MKRIKYFAILIFFLLTALVAESAYLGSAFVPDESSVKSRQAFVKITGFGSFAFYNETPEARHSGHSEIPLFPFRPEVSFASFVYTHDKP